MLLWLVNVCHFKITKHFIERSMFSSCRFIRLPEPMLIYLFTNYDHLIKGCCEERKQFESSNVNVAWAIQFDWAAKFDWAREHAFEWVSEYCTERDEPRYIHHTRDEIVQDYRKVHQTCCDFTPKKIKTTSLQKMAEVTLVNYILSGRINISA